MEVYLSVMGFWEVLWVVLCCSSKVGGFEKFFLVVYSVEVGFLWGLFRKLWRVLVFVCVLSFVFFVFVGFLGKKVLFFFWVLDFL